MKKRIKKTLRDLSENEYEEWKRRNCLDYDDVGCDGCRFLFINCNHRDSNCWIKHKDLYSEKFLNQEVEIEVEVEITSEEKIILENLSYGWKYIVRDKDEVLFLFDEKPKKCRDTPSGIWSGDGDIHYLEFPFHHMFQFIQWEDKEPCLIEDLLKE